MSTISKLLEVARKVGDDSENDANYELLEAGKQLSAP
jgi:hypothetical protein